MLRGVNNLKRSGHPARRFARATLGRVRGFTLLELMIVISIIMILMAVAVPVYNQSVVQARESVLRSNLSTLRSVISQYTLDKQKAPQSLDDLVQGGYLRQIPVDPMTRQTNWVVHIPAGIPHSFLLPAGKHITYVLLKFPAKGR